MLSLFQELFDYFWIYLKDIFFIYFFDGFQLLFNIKDHASNHHNLLIFVILSMFMRPFLLLHICELSLEKHGRAIQNS